jgi:RNA polymerase sigma-70 factor (ECF subfamily)
LAGRHGFSISDRDDIEQELRLHLLRRLAKFDPDIAPWNAFVQTLLERHAATLVAQRRRKTRSKPKSRRCEGSHESRIDIALDTATVLAGLPPKTRRLCERLKRDSVAEVARQMGVPRSTLRSRIQRLRERFQMSGETDSFK